MKPANIVKTLKCSKEEIQKLADLMRETGWEFKEVQHAYYQAKQGNVTVVSYLSGKVVISGPESEIKPILETLNSFDTSDLSVSWVDHVGVDESGKGDFFGPLVIAGAYVTKDNLQQLKSVGVRDSKTVSDISVKKMRNELVKLVDYDEIVISPAKYNELYAQMKNVNKVLAWGHARVIENLLERHPECKQAVSDQFSKSKSRIQNVLLTKGRQIELIQMHKGESDPAVAAASIIARAKFLDSLTKLSKEFGLEFVKGASDRVIEVGKEFCSKNSTDALKQVAKLHFATTQKVLT